VQDTWIIRDEIREHGGARRKKKKKKGHVIWHVVKTRQNIENNVLGM
jgi:hypothetical protein